MIRDWLKTRWGNNFGHFVIGLIMCLLVAAVTNLWTGWLAQSFYWMGREAAHVEINSGEDFYGRWWVPYYRVMFRPDLKTMDEFCDFWSPVIGVGLVVLIVQWV